ncbi:HEAT repeat domain-containing protein [Planctomicrobium sp. SH668]|uniref:HEAT repeat domain-containing protein n=1 Tax=Planctomicrobium sp. SH668 TaxID=3448126 RepID=UPI003F5B0F9F
MGTMNDAVRFLFFATLWCSTLSPSSSILGGDAASLKYYGGRSLADWRIFVKEHALSDLATPQTLNGMISVVQDPQAPWADRKQFAVTLGRVGPAAASTVPIFIQLLGNNESDRESVQSFSLKALGLIGVSGNAALPEVLHLATDEHSSFLIRATAMETAARIGPDAPQTLSSLIRVMQSDLEHPVPHSKNEVRRAAAEAIALLGPIAGPALPELMRALQSDWPLLQRSAATAIGSLGPRGELATQSLTDLVLFGEDNDAREAAVDALGNIGRPAISSLELLLNDRELIVRRFAIRGLRQSVDTRGAVLLLSPLLSDDTSIIQTEAAAAVLKHQQQGDALDVLFKGLQSEDREVRMTSYRGLKENMNRLKPLQRRLEEALASPDIHPQTRTSMRHLVSQLEDDE